MWIDPNTQEVFNEAAEGLLPVLYTQPPLTARLEKAILAAPTFVGENWVSQWQIVPLTLDEQALLERDERQALTAAVEAERECAKEARQKAVDAIKVTTQAGNTFDGDETSQTRMARAVLAMQATGAPSVTWVLADNTVIQATAPELTEALALAGAEQARLWVIE